MAGGTIAWRVFEGVTIAVGAAVVVVAGTSIRLLDRHELKISSLETQSTDQSDRIDAIEGAGFVVEIAQANEKLKNLENAVDTARENAVAIAGLRSTVDGQTRQLQRIESSQSKNTDLIIRALERKTSMREATSDEMATRADLSPSPAAEFARDDWFGPNTTEDSP